MRSPRVPALDVPFAFAALSLLAVLMASAAYAQQPAKPQAPQAQPAKPAERPPAPGPAPAPAQPPAQAPAGLPQAENYTYNPDGRRDPFTSLIGTGANVDSRTPTREGGAAALSIADISVRGIMLSRGTLVAMVQGPNNKTYIVHQGDKLLDGVIKTITNQGLVVIQEVNDPLSLVKQREVSKLLRSFEGGK